MTIRHGISTVLIAGAAAGLVACGGSGSGGNGKSQDDYDRQLAFAACLRKAGIDAPDPQRGPNGEVRSQIRVPKGIAPRRMEQIQKDCMRKSGFNPKPPSKEAQAGFRDAALKFARCMRAQGVDVPDPQPTNGGFAIQKPGTGSKDTLNPSSPAFKRAQEACQSLLPGPKGGKGGGGLVTSGKP